MEVEEVQHFKQLQQKNSRLKRLLAERDLEIDVIKRCWQKSGKWHCPPQGSPIHQIEESIGEARLRFDRIEPEKSSPADTGENRRKS